MEKPEHDKPQIFCHFSDIHISSARFPWKPRNLFSKSFAAWINLRILGRRKHFEHSASLLIALQKDILQQNPDGLVFSGDASAMGFENEIEDAAQVLKTSDCAHIPGIAVPGNHDLHNHWSNHVGYFEKHFANWQKGIRVDDHFYPFAKKIGSVWFIGVNSASPTILPWDARGAVGKHQVERLKKLMGMLDRGSKILVTHYPHSLPNGKNESYFRKLTDRESLTKIANEYGVSIWLHGHRHNHYFLNPDSKNDFVTVCSGSATQTGKWSYSKITILNQNLTIEQRSYDPKMGSFVPACLYKACIK